MIICQGCGQSFSVPAGYSRTKIQCPECGIICAVPKDAETAKVSRASRKSAPESEVDWDRVESEPEPAKPIAPESVPLFDDEPVAAPPPRDPPVKVKESLIPCRRCGKMIKKQRECPHCDAIATTNVCPAISLDLDDPPMSVMADEDDNSPYLTADRDIPICPACHKEMPIDAVVCTSCGYDTQKRKKLKRTYQPIERDWETDMPLSRRLLWFGLYQMIHWLLAAMSATTDFGITPFVITWPMLTGMLCFVLGTYDSIHMKRDQRGRVRITKRWRFCFVPLTPVVTEVRGFEGVTTGQWHDAGFLEYFVFVSLLILGVIPGLIWWYHAIHQTHFHVALAVDHGRADVYVYRGKSQEQMAEIADALCDASGLQRLS